MNEIDALKEQVKALSEELERLKHEEKKPSKQEELLDQLESKLHISKDDAMQMAQTLSDEVKKSPLKSLAIAAGIGFIAARVLR